MFLSGEVSRLGVSAHPCENSSVINSVAQRAKSIFEPIAFRPALSIRTEPHCAILQLKGSAVLSLQHSNKGFQLCLTSFPETQKNKTEISAA